MPHTQVAKSNGSRDEIRHLMNRISSWNNCYCGRKLIQDPLHKNAEKDLADKLGFN